MAPPSALSIATQSVQRLAKEEAYYHQELARQNTRVQKLEREINIGGEGMDSNAEFTLRQEKAAVAETQGVFAPLRKRIVEAVRKLEEQVALAESVGSVDKGEMEKAREALETGEKVGGVESDGK